MSITNEIANEITRLQKSKIALRNDLINKGLDSSDTSLLDELVGKIAVTYTKAYIKSCDSIANLFNTNAVHTFIDMDDLEYDDTANCRSFYQTFMRADKVVALNTSNGLDFVSMYWGSKAINYPDINTAKATSVSHIYQNCINAEKVSMLNIGKCTTLWSPFQGCPKLRKVEFLNWNLLAANQGNICADCYSLKAFIIRSFENNKGFGYNNLTNCYHFTGTVNETYNPNGDKDGYIYVPRAYVEELKSATNWSVYADQIRALEDYTVDGTTTGALKTAEMGI